MGSVKKVRRKVATPKSRKVRVYSTSEARANFAQALETAQAENAVIGFDRYGRMVAALVPVEAVYMLAGMDHTIPASVRKGIESDSRQFVRNAASGVAASEPRAKRHNVKKAAPSKKAKRGRKGRTE